MHQPSPGTPSTERRRDPREPKSFAFWIRRLETMRRTSAWMLDMSRGGAAFMVESNEAPPIGERVELIEMLTADREVREGGMPLPRFARVLRHDCADEPTQKVAVRFETDAEVALDELVARRAQAFRLKSRIAPVPPPVSPPPTSAMPPFCNTSFTL